MLNPMNHSIGDVVVAALRNPSLSHNKFIRVTSFTHSFSEIVNIHSDVLGIKYDVEMTPMDVWDGYIEKARQAGNKDEVTLLEVLGYFPRGLGVVVDDGLFPDVQRDTLAGMLKERRGMNVDS